MNWIWENRQWIFSGVGVTTLILIGSFVWSMTRRRKTTSPQTTQPEPSGALRRDQFTKPTPIEITKQIRSLPPFQQQAAAEAYRGVKVRWSAEFSGVQEELFGPRARNKTTLWTIFASCREGTSFETELVCCHNISLEEYPNLKILPDRSPIVVSGTIQAMRPSIHLDDVFLEFP